MLGLSLGLKPGGGAAALVPMPAGIGWDLARFPLEIVKAGGKYRAQVAPRDLVDPGIWTGAAIHVDGVSGDDARSGLGAADGDFTQAKRSIHAAFVAGNATGAAYRVIVKAGQYEESAFSRNGNEEPTQPVAILGWGGSVRYRTGPFSVSWSDAGATHSAGIGSVRRVFRTDQRTAQGLYVELAQAADLAACQGTGNCWFADGGTLHVNIGRAPGSGGIAVIRSFHGARFLTHARDLYLEDIHCEGGITGALHLDAVADRNVVGVNCSFRYSAPSNVNSPLDAVQIRRTNGLVAFFGCDGSGGADDGWSFHEDGHAGMHVVMQGCIGFGNGAFAASSCNGLTTHDGVRLIDLNGAYGWSRNGTEVHCIQTTRSWLAGTQATARDIDGTCVAFKCSNQARMWLQDTVADAAGGAVQNFAIEANGGSVFTRGHVALGGDVGLSSGGTVSSF
ncbi:hypothetical protein FGK63_16280 [Ruegeria sediminis]|uniref:Right-handed parallel beta-helix repeat-containing protein n=1 Tax=Ruegeria sediminis TaxID=2583820 RepID=A0ABY2WUA1_9RHOB|nr:hypothetical protein [Ruegeria sediminis]TMV05599.1 hypothetical protein FGK63_16280 [Ruegeria sediminis]